MRSSWIFAALCTAALAFSSGAQAQHPPLKKMPVAKKIPLKKPVPKKTLAPASKSIAKPATPKPIPMVIPKEVTACMSRAAVLGQEQEKLDNYRAQSAGISAEIKQLQARLKELRARKGRVKQSVGFQTRRVKKMEASYDKQCKKHENCDKYEAQASSLDRQSKPIENALNQISADISDVRKTIAALQNRIAPLRADYKQHRCGNLVPGQTTQSTIAKCSNIFSQWNDLQNSVTYNTTRLTSLKSTYRRNTTRLDSLNNRAANVSSYLAKNCQNSPKKAQMDRYQAVRERAKKLGQELDEMIRAMGKLKKEPLVRR